MRLDRDLTDLFKTLDAKIGNNQWLVFLTADHGAAHPVSYMKEHQLPADFLSSKMLIDSLNNQLNQKFQTTNLVISITNDKVNFNLEKISRSSLDFDAIKKFTVEILQMQPGVMMAVDINKIGESSIHTIRIFPLSCMAGILNRVP